MRKVLIAGKTQKICESISELLTDGAPPVGSDSSGASAFSDAFSRAFSNTSVSESEFRTVCVTDGIRARCANAESFDIIIISTPLEDEFGLDLAAELHGKSGAALIVITKGELAEEIQNKLKFTGAFVIGRPTNRAALLQAVRLAGIAGENVKRLTEEKYRLEREIEDMKVINRAKSCLIQYLKLTEEQAHRYLQRQAMELGITRRRIFL